MTRSLRILLIRWLDVLAMGVILSTALSCALITYDVAGFASLTDRIEGGWMVRTTVWSLLILALAPCAAFTDRALRRKAPGRSGR